MQRLRAQHYESMGTVMPGARLDNIIKPNTKGILGRNDAVIVCGGANDIRKNESNTGLRQLMNFLLPTYHYFSCNCSS
jgi:hypothetical protein